MDMELVRVVQLSLNKKFNTNLIVDGVWGANTANAILHINTIPHHWDKERKIIGVIQYMCDTYSINGGPIDGLWGPQTEYGFQHLKALVETGSTLSPWRDDEGVGAVSTSTGWPIQTQEELEKYYGKVGENQTKAICPYPVKIAWEPSKIITRFSCHEKVASSIERVLRYVLDHYGQAKIEELGLDMWGGCLNVRKMRGGTKWSTHAWGISIDWDPARNKLRWDKSKANFAKPEYEAWWQIWEQEGWVSLGRARDYDWMHVQAAKVK